MKKSISRSLEETQQIAADWLEHVSVSVQSPVPTVDEAVVVGLSGPLGSGKTAFVQAVGRILEIKEIITSPTFVIMKLYETSHDYFRRMVHIDAYRLEKGSELDVLGFEKLVSDPHNLILIEWPENVKEGLPESTRIITFETIGESERAITIN